MLGGWDFLFFFFDVPLGNIKPTSILLPDLPDLLEVVAWRTSLCGTGIADVTPGRLFWWLLHQLGNPFRTIWLLFFQDSLPDSYILRMKEAQDHSYRSDQWLLRFCPPVMWLLSPYPSNRFGAGKWNCDIYMIQITPLISLPRDGPGDLLRHSAIFPRNQYFWTGWM